LAERERQPVTLDHPAKCGAARPCAWLFFAGARVDFMGAENIR
jgi:hypothetical protein